MKINITQKRKSPGLKYNITIDGVVGSGKTTIARMLADRYQMNLLPTGWIYRTVALLGIRQKTQTINELISIMHNQNNSITIDLKTPGILLNREDITEELFSPEVEEIVHELSSLYEVKTALLKKIRELVNGRGWILEGRDCGSHILPDADLKFFLTVSIEEALKRRQEIAPSTTLPSIVARDREDRIKEYGHLCCPLDAIVIDTTHLKPEQVLSVIEFWISERNEGSSHNNP